MRRPCIHEGCNHTVTHNNRSGICGYHKLLARQAKFKNCDGCGTLLTPKARGPLCKDCIYARAKVRIKNCTACGKSLGYMNKSGLCQAHFNEVRGMQSRPRATTSAKPYTVRQLVKAASFLTGVSEADITGPRRLRTYVNIRRAIVFAAKPFYSGPDIGRVLGGRDHSSIFHALEQGEALKDDWKFKAMQERLTKEATAIAENERNRILHHLERLAA